MDDLIDKLGTLNIESETAERIAENYMEYMWVNLALNYALCFTLIGGMGVLLLVATGFFKRNRN